MSPQHLHPFFTDGRGSSATPLQTQAAVLFLKLQNVSNAAVHQVLNVNHKFTEDMATRWTYSRQEYVIAKQKEIRLGGRKTWVNVEGDEASFANTDISNIDDSVDSQKPVLWEQWCGLIERGRPESLNLGHPVRRSEPQDQAPSGRLNGSLCVRSIWKDTTSSSIRNGSRGSSTTMSSIAKRG